MKTIHRDVVAGLIRSQDGKILMGMKDPNSGGVYVNCWHLPGGGVEPNEEREEALKRELLEEVGIDISPYSVTLIDDTGSGESEKSDTDTGETVLCKMRFFVYRIDITDRNADEIKQILSDDLVKTEWISNRNLYHYPLTPPSRILFRKLGYIP